MTAPASPSSHLWSALRRFWWVVLIITGLTAYAADKSEALAPGVQYTAAGQFIVPVRGPVVDPAAPPSTRPNSPFDAQGLARTYAVVLQSDMAILGAIAAPTGTPVEDLERDMSVEAVNSTSVVEVSFTADSEELARAHFAGLVNALAVGATPNIPAGNLILLQDARVTAEEGLGIDPYILGGIAGLILGGALALLLDRLDTRVRSSTDLRRLTELPVLDLTRGQGQVAEDVLAMRTRRLSDEIDEVAVVGTDAVSATATAEIANRLRAADERLSALASYEPLAPRAQWHGYGVLADGNEAELAVQRADATVVVVAVGSRMGSAERVLDRMRLLGLSAVVIALVPVARRGLRRPAAPQDDAPAVPSPAPEASQVERPSTRDLAGRP